VEREHAAVGRRRAVEGDLLADGAAALLPLLGVLGRLGPLGPDPVADRLKELQDEINKLKVELDNHK
jgi:hypothetical protein